MGKNLPKWNPFPPSTFKTVINLGLCYVISEIRDFKNLLLFCELFEESFCYLWENKLSSQIKRKLILAWKHWRFDNS
jgi:hypothetical protein